MRPRRRLLAGVAVVITIALAAGFGWLWLGRPPDPPGPQLHVAGNKLVNSAGQPVILRGVNRSGGEYSCAGGHGIWDGPMDRAAVAAIRSWHVNAVRVPLNEACWNGQRYIDPADAGPRYQRAVRAYVRLLNRDGIVAILDLHWSDGSYSGTSAGCTSARAVCGKPMPDRAQAIPFWTSVARTFAGNNAVIFDLFNEPFPEAAAGPGDESAAWRCWRDGGTACAGIAYPVAGMQSLVNAVRSTGAGNVIMLGGLDFANDLTRWLAYEPRDPDGNLVASWHAYSFSPCHTRACWQAEVRPVMARVPVIAGEIGDNTCSGSYLDTVMSWLDSTSSGYLAWAWNTDFGCAGGFSLITSYSGRPTVPGAALKAHLAALAARAGRQG